MGEQKDQQREDEHDYREIEEPKGEQQGSGDKGGEGKGDEPEKPEGKEVDANSSAGTPSKTEDTQSTGQGGETKPSGRGDDRRGGSPSEPARLPVRAEGDGGKADEGGKAGGEGGDGPAAGGTGGGKVRKGFFYQRHRRERRTS